MVADPFLLDLLEKIEDHCWAVQYVLGGEDPNEPPFGYTVGLTTLGHPEIIMRGLPARSTMGYLNSAGEQVREGRRFEAGVITEIRRGVADSRAAFVAVTDTSELVAVEQIYHDVKAVQLIWPDSRRNLPWEPGWMNGPDSQPLLGPAPAVWITD